MTTITINNTARPSFDAQLQARTLRIEADRFERNLVIRELREALEEGATDKPLDWDVYDIDLAPGSSLYQLHMPASALLKALTDEPFIQQLSVQTFRKPLSEAFVNADGSLFIRGDAWEPITQTVNNRPSAQAQLKCLTDIANNIGGIVSSTNTVEMSQWLKFHDLHLPTDLTQTKTLLDFLMFDIPEPDHLSHYWDQLVTTEPGGVVLTSEQHAAIRKLTAEFLPPKKKLLDTLYANVLNTHPVDWDDAGHLIKSVVTHPSSRALAKRYIDALGWYGANADEPLNDQDLDQLLVTAILLDLTAETGVQNPIGSIALYSPDNVDLPHVLVRQQLEHYLVNNRRVSAHVAPLAAHLLLANVAPEFLIRDLPYSPLLGSIGWVTFARTVALIELQSPGASRLMTFERVMEYAEFESVGPLQEKLSALAAINPIIEWALSNSVITRETWQQSGTDALQQASSAFQAFLEQLNQASIAFGTPPPSRRALALAQLQKILPDCDYLEKEFLTQVETPWQYQAGVPYAGADMFDNVKMSMLELHMSGDLARQQWNDPDGDLFKKHPTLLAELNTLSLDYESPVRDYQRQIEQALITNLRLALAGLDEDDQKHLLRSEITFYTVRPSAAFEVESHAAIGGKTGVHVFGMKESQQSIDAATGHYGVVMCASYNGKTTCYELFSLHGKCQKNSGLGQAIDHAGLHSARPRVDFKGDLERLVDPAPLRSMPLDIANYTHGSYPNTGATSSNVVLDKLAVLAAPIEVTRYKNGVYQRFHYANLERIADFVARHRPLTTYAELMAIVKEQTKLEKLLSKKEERTEFMLNLMIPFRSCIMDLASGERVRVAQGVFGCIMDAIAVVGGIVGTASKIAGIMSRTVSSCSKIASIAKQLVKLVISTFNPLDGLKSYAVHGVKLLAKGGLRLNRVGIDVLTKARSQVYRLSNVADSYDLVKASKRADLTQGTWISKDSSETLNVWACRSRTSQWHALNRFGRPWGESLKNFRRTGDIRLPRFEKQLPSLYTRTVIENALSTARLKMDAGVRVLSQANKKVDINALTKLLLGDGPTESVYNVLMAQKSYYSAVSLHNVLLDETDSDSDMLTFDRAEFQAWETAGLLRSQKQFIRVVCADLNERYRENKLSQGVIADDLIRTLFHAVSGVVDLSTARRLPVTNSGYTQVDVAPLLNLANGFHPVSDEGSPTRYHDRAQARNNADSWAVLTALLSQMETDPSTFTRNLSTMNTALQAHRQGAITQVVPIDLNRI